MSILALNNPQPANQTPADLTLNSNSQAGGASSSGQLIGSFQPGSQSPGSPSLPNNPGNNGSVGSPGITISTGDGPSQIAITQTPDGQNMSRFTPFGEINDDFASMTEDDRVFIDVLANDIGAVSVLSILGAPSLGGFTYGSPFGLQVTIANNGLIFESNGFLDQLGPNSLAEITFFYQAMMEDGSLQSGMVRVRAFGVNDAPTANDDEYIVSNFAVLNVGPAPGIISNDFDPDGPILQTTLVSGPANGFLTLFPNGTFTYDPDPGFVGTDSFVYRLSDSELSDTAKVTITVTNAAPVAEDDEYDVNHDSNLIVAAAMGVLDNDSDGDGNPLTVALVTGPANGTLTLNPDGSFEYTPDAFFIGTDSFTYSASDGITSDTATVTINVINEAPDAVDDEYDVNHDSNLIVAAAAGALDNDSDPEGDPLTAILITGPNNGTLTFNPDGSFEYTPNAFFVGTDSFTYNAYDGTSTDTATVTINVINTAPDAVNDVYSIAADGTINIPAPGILGNDTDAEGDSLTISAVTNQMLSGSAIVVATGQVAYTPASGFVGIETFDYTISDGVASDTATVTFYVGLPTFYQGAFQASGEVLSGDADDLFLSFDPNPSLGGYFLFYAEAGDTVTIDVDRAEGDFDPYLWVFQGIITDPAATFGTDIQSSDPGFVGSADDTNTPGALPGPFGDPRLTFVAPSTGYYTAIVTEGASGANSGGDGRFDFTIGFTIA